MKYNTTSGKLIRKARESRNLTRPQLAKSLGITPGYLGHLERDSHVHLSQALVGRIKLRLRVAIPTSAVERNNAAARRWYRAYRARTA